MTDLLPQYSRNQFVWEDSDEFNSWWGLYLSVDKFIKLVFTGAIFPFLTLYLKVGDSYLLMVSLVSTLFGIIIRQSAQKPYMMFLGNVVGMFTAVHTVTAR